MFVYQFISQSDSVAPRWKESLFFKNIDSYHLGATSKHFSFNCFNSYFPPFLWPLICSYWDWLTDELVNKQNLVWSWSNQMFLRSGVSSEHLEEGRLPQMFRNPSPRQKMCLNQKILEIIKLQIVIYHLNSISNYILGPIYAQHLWITGDYSPPNIS